MIEAPTTVEDIKTIEPTTHQDRVFVAQLGKPEAALFLRTYARTLKDEGKPIAICGVTPVWTGVGDLWVVMSDEAYRQAAVTARHLRQLTEDAREVILAHRLQATVADDNERMMTFLKKLGFEQEGCLRAYYEPGRDYLMFSKIWREPLEVKAA